MEKETKNIKLLLVDDEADFRLATSKTLVRRGLKVTEAASGAEAIAAIAKEPPDIVLLDLKMPGLSGIETLQKIRENNRKLPVIILTGHGDFQDAVAGIKRDIVDFIQKPVDVEKLSARIHSLLTQASKPHLRERTIAELMKPPSAYPRLYVDEPVAKALDALQKAFFKRQGDDAASGKVRSLLVYDRTNKFLGLVRFPDLLKLVIPTFLDEAYTSFFTGMFLAQCKVIGRRDLTDIMGEKTTVNVQAPLMEAVHLMTRDHLINLPVVLEGELVGILRERDIILEIANNIDTFDLVKS